MPYGQIKVDEITFTNAGVDQTISVSGVVASISGNITATGTISGDVIQGGTLVSGATVTGAAGQFGTITGNTAGFTTVTGTTVTGTTASFTSGVFTNISGGTHTITSGVFASGAEATPSISFVGDPNTGIYSPGADQVAISTNGTGRLFVDANGKIGVNATPPAGNQGLYVSVSSPTADTAGIQAKNGANVAIELFLTGATYSYAGVGANEAWLRSSRAGAGANLNIGSDEACAVKFITNAQERLRITSDGKVGLGTSSPDNTLHVVGTGRFNVSGANNAVIASDSGDPFIYTEQAAGLKFGTNSAVRMTINSSGSVGVGTTSPASKLTAAGTQGNFRVDPDSVSNEVQLLTTVPDNSGFRNYRIRTNELICDTNGTERARIDGSGRLLVGTSTSRIVEDLQGNGPQGLIQIEAANSDAIMSIISAGTADAGRAGTLSLGRHRNSTVGGTPTIVQNGDTLGAICFAGGDGVDMRTKGASIAAQVDGTPGTDDMPGRLVFSTTADGASSPTERMRITQSGFVNIGSQGTDIIWNQTSATGVTLGTAGVIQAARSNDQLMLLNRIGNDGTLVTFAQDGVTEGDIAVSGTAVSYNGAHLSRWSQIPGIDPYDKIVRPEILRGTVMSNLDEMCDWVDPESGEAQNNEQLNKAKVSDVEGDKNVAGIFQSWDDDDGIWVNDYYLAMTGDFIIRIGAGVTVERGDLLMSAGDGTAKPQDDDIIRSKTIAKVTSTTVSCTYDDGSYCVPCVLMAC